MIEIARREDVPAMLAIYGPYVRNSTASFEYEPPTEEVFFGRFDSITRQFPWIKWVENGEVLGYAYASAPYSREAYSWCAEPTIYLAPQARGKGIAAKLYTTLEEILRRQGYQVCYALVTQENEASVRFHEKMGYEKRAFYPSCGFKFNRWLGLYWMEKRLCEVKTPNGFPEPWMDIVQNAERLKDFLADLSLS